MIVSPEQWLRAAVREFTSMRGRHSGWHSLSARQKIAYYTRVRVVIQAAFPEARFPEEYPK